ncbi:MAG: hypothetical protein ACI38Y_00490 [Candidatus Methanomethylophilaceae archaeon]
MTRCPKCGHDNPKDTLFCEECDWRMDQPVSKMKKEKTASDVLIYAVVALVLGVASMAMYLLDVSIVGIIAGILGMVAGGYAINLPRYIECNKMACTAMAGIGILLSIVGFIFGLANFA